MSSLTLTEQERGRGLTNLLSKVNPVLTPRELGSFVPPYKNFIPIPGRPECHGLMFTTARWPELLQSYEHATKVFVLASGISAGGKDTLRKEMQLLYPGLIHKVVTGTSRRLREEKGEANGVDYYFFETPAKFLAAVAAGEFIEHVQQGKSDQEPRYYGLPKRSLNDALAQPAPVVWCEIEMSAWDEVQRYVQGIQENQVAVVRLFVLPCMKFNEYTQHLGEQRADDLQGRLTRTGWELAEAPQRSDLLVSNFFSEDMSLLKQTAQATAEEFFHLPFAA